MAKTKPIIPIQAPLFRAEDFAPENQYQFVNQWATQVTNAANLANGAVGPSVLPAGIDVAGGSVTGLATPKNPTDAVSLGHAEGNYSAPVLGPQLDLGGSSALKGLTGLQIKFNALPASLSKGISGTATLAKLTTLGSNGSLTFVDGIITAYVPPS